MALNPIYYFIRSTMNNRKSIIHKLNINKQKKAVLLSKFQNKKHFHSFSFSPFHEKENKNNRNYSFGAGPYIGYSGTGGGGGGGGGGNFGPTMMILSALGLYTAQQLNKHKL